jgi:hypothetical protein
MKSRTVMETMRTLEEHMIELKPIRDRKGAAS